MVVMVDKDHKDQQVDKDRLEHLEAKDQQVDKGLKDQQVVTHKGETSRGRACAGKPTTTWL